MSLVEVDLPLVDEIERASVLGWPPSVVEELPDGWILRATPGLDRGRSCHALTPRDRPLGAVELREALERVRSFSAHHGIRGGLQLSPLEIHGDHLARLVAAGWEPIWKVWVMTVDRDAALARVGASTQAGAGFGWSATRSATEGWQGNWRLCQPTLTPEIVDAHVQTVFANLDGRGIFGSIPGAASGICVEDADGAWAGLFSLVVREGLRGLGLGRQLVRSLLEESAAKGIYLQVSMDNAVAIRLYESFGFRISHSYQHLLAPLGWAGG